MADNNYIVLKAEDSFVPTFENLGTGGPTAGTRGGPNAQVAAQKVELEEVSMSSADADDLRRDPRTVAVAPPMPLTLISPVASDDGDGPDILASGNTWGVEAVQADSSNFDGSGVKIAVLDTGIDPNHPAFAGVNLVRKNFTAESDDDIHGHGTHCAGTIFGRDVNGTRIGVARGIDDAVIAKVLGQGGGSSASLANAIHWSVEQGANIVSMSLGIDFPGYVDFLVNQRNRPVAPATSEALTAYRANINLFSRLMDYLNARSSFGDGVIVVAATGNESQRPDFTIAVAPPAAGNGVVSVGALQQGANGMTVANFSNTQCNVSAPGVGVQSAATGTTGLTSMSGTSMATPHAAGIAALWAQHEMQVSNRISTEGMLAKLLGMATRNGLNPNSTAEDVGAGIVQAP